MVTAVPGRDTTTPRMAMSAIQTEYLNSDEAKPTEKVKQLASESISKVTYVQQPEPKGSAEPSALRKEIEAVDDSEVWQSDPTDYKIHLLDGYGTPYHIKIIKYVHDQNKELANQIEQLNKQTEQLTGHYVNQNKQLIEKVEQLGEQNKAAKRAAKATKRQVR